EPPTVVSKTIGLGPRPPSRGTTGLHTPAHRLFLSGRRVFRAPALVPVPLRSPFSYMATSKSTKSTSSTKSTKAPAKTAAKASGPAKPSPNGTALEGLSARDLLTVLTAVRKGDFSARL